MKRTLIGIFVYMLVISLAYTENSMAYEDPAILRFFTLYQVGYQDFKSDELNENGYYTRWRGGDLIRYYHSPQPIQGPYRKNPQTIQDFRTELPDSLAQRFTMAPSEAADQNLILSPYRWMGVVEFDSDETAPASPNCEEESFTALDFENLFNQDSINHQDDFLRAIPKSVLSRFTFLTESESLQHHGVDSSNPRVMRFSNDGKFTMTYTCHPETKSFNTIEVLFFDDNEKRYRFMHASFDQNGMNKNLVKDHNSCLACHGGSDPRPNWNPYQTWPKALGSDDDMIIEDRGLPIPPLDGSYDDRPFEWTLKHSPEATSYLALKEKWGNSACFDSLPWPEKESKYTQFYPYLLKRKAPNYQYRNNAYYSIVQTRLNTHRLYRKLKSSPSFDRFRIQLAMEAIQCPQSNLSGVVPQLNQEVDPDSRLGDIVRYFLNVRGGQTSVNLHEGYKNLGLFIHLLGIRPIDWDFRFTPTAQQERVQFYNHGMWHPVHYILDVILDDLEKEIPEIEPLNLRVNWFSNLFGRKLMCIDEMAEKYWPSDSRNEQICEILANYQQSKGQPDVMSDEELQESKAILTSSHFYQRIKSEGPVSRELGREILTETCSQCHNGQVLPFNFKNHQDLKVDLKDLQEGLIGLVDFKLGTDESCQMPMKVAGPCLSQAEKQSVLDYLGALLDEVKNE